MGFFYRLILTGCFLFGCLIFGYDGVLAMEVDLPDSDDKLLYRFDCFAKKTTVGRYFTKKIVDGPYAGIVLTFEDREMVHSCFALGCANSDLAWVERGFFLIESLDEESRKRRLEMAESELRKILRGQAALDVLLNSMIEHKLAYWFRPTLGEDPSRVVLKDLSKVPPELDLKYFEPWEPTPWVKKPHK
jgi:hypothetical protein